MSSELEYLKLLLPEVMRPNLERNYLKNVQLRVKTSSDIKFMRAVQVLAVWLEKEFEGEGGINTLAHCCKSKAALYKKLSECGYVWNAKTRLWRLDKRLKAARHHQEDEL